MTPISTAPAHVNPIQWNQSVGYARQAAARIFRDGGSPAEAMALFGIKDCGAKADWSKAVEAIAETLCASNVMRKAA